MPSKRNNRKNSRKSGAGYLQPAEYYNPAAHQPSGNAQTISSAPVPGWVRPPMSATISGGKKSRKSTRRTRKSMFGGFAPALMGSFVSNAQSVVVPLVLYGLYNVFGTNKTVKAVSSVKKNGGAKKASRKANRKN